MTIVFICLASAPERPAKENGPTSPAPKSETPKSGNLEEFYPLNMSSNTPNSLSPVSRDESKGHPERKRRASDEDSCEVRAGLVLPGNARVNLTLVSRALSSPLRYEGPVFILLLL